MHSSSLAQRFPPVSVMIVGEYGASWAAVFANRSASSFPSAPACPGTHLMLACRVGWYCVAVVWCLNSQPCKSCEISSRTLCNESEGENGLTAHRIAAWLSRQAHRFLAPLT